METRLQKVKRWLSKNTSATKENREFIEAVQFLKDHSQVVHGDWDRPIVENNQSLVDEINHSVEQLSSNWNARKVRITSTIASSLIAGLKSSEAPTEKIKTFYEYTTLRRLDRHADTLRTQISVEPGAHLAKRPESEWVKYGDPDIYDREFEIAVQACSYFIQNKAVQPDMLIKFLQRWRCGIEKNAPKTLTKPNYLKQ